MVNNQEQMDQSQTRNIKLKYKELYVMVHNYEDTNQNVDGQVEQWKHTHCHYL